MWSCQSFFWRPTCRLEAIRRRCWASPTSWAFSPETERYRIKTSTFSHQNDLLMSNIQIYAKVRNGPFRANRFVLGSEESNTTFTCSCSIHWNSLVPVEKVFTLHQLWTFTGSWLQREFRLSNHKQIWIPTQCFWSRNTDLYLVYAKKSCLDLENVRPNIFPC